VYCSDLQSQSDFPKLTQGRIGVTSILRIYVYTVTKYTILVVYFPTVGHTSGPKIAQYINFTTYFLGLRFWHVKCFYREVQQEAE